MSRLSQRRWFDRHYRKWWFVPVVMLRAGFLVVWAVYEVVKEAGKVVLRYWKERK